MKAKRFMSVLIAVLMMVSCFAISASAVESYTLNIHVYETNDSNDINLRDDTNLPDSNTTKNPIASDAVVKFDIYKVADNATETTRPVDGLVETIESVSGVATFTTEQAGRYLVIVNDDPAYADADNSIVPFLVDLPRTNAEGTAKENTVDVYPKMLVTGAIVFTKTFNGTAPSAGVSATFSVTGPNNYSNTVTTDANGVIKLDGLAFGEYTFVETAVTDPFILDNTPKTINVVAGGCFDTDGSLIGTAATGTMNNGSDTMPKVSKKVSDDGVSFGQSANINSYNNNVATWRIAVSIPDDIKDYKQFTVKDTVDNRLTVQETSANVTIKNGTLAEGAVTANEFEGRNLTITFDPEKLAANAGGVLYITFTTKILDDSGVITTGTAIPNHVTVEYKNAAWQEGTAVPTTSNTDGKDPEDPEKDNPTTDPYVYTGELVVNKVDGEGNTITTSEAEFTLYKEDGTTEVAKFTTQNGKFTIDGLLDGTYKLVETKAPSGYELNSNPIEIKIGDGNVLATGSVANSNVSKNITNIPKTKLPLTGGMGTTLFSIIGLALVSFGGVMFVKSRKAKASL